MSFAPECGGYTLVYTFPILKYLWRYSCQNPIWILWGKCWSKFLTVTNFEDFTSSGGEIFHSKFDRIWKCCPKRKVIVLCVTRKGSDPPTKDPILTFPPTRLLLCRIRHHPNTQPLNANIVYQQQQQQQQSIKIHSFKFYILSNIYK